MIVPTLCVGMPQSTLCVRSWDAERPGLHSHAERGNDHYGRRIPICGMSSSRNSSPATTNPYRP
ncbi:hypothetical protein CUN61_07340 [Pseudomonas arsenicoxydans]|uniref:Uncharacterized protein n=1 Tax=Pseudomonas arsenicoxydans TaxID=702115 RepID=A0A4P6G1C4_9PSED|nr:hypothetical protein CUN61_07340 [Pseudomonas arsenicoxydans]